MNEQTLAAKRDALARAISRRLHEVVREEFSMLEERRLEAHCLAVSAALVEGAVAEATLGASGALSQDAGIVYRMEVR